MSTYCDKCRYVWVPADKISRVQLCPLHAAAEDLLDACNALVAACDTAPPVELIKHISMACERAKLSVAKAKP